MKFKPLYDRVLVKREEPESKSKGGIYFPETGLERPMLAIVVEVGDGRIDEAGRLTPLRIQVGARVALGQYAGTDIVVGDMKYSIVREDEILGWID